MQYFNIRKDILSDQFPSIWLEITHTNDELLMIAGFYREWTQAKDKSTDGQMTRLEVNDTSLQHIHIPMHLSFLQIYT